MKRVQLPDGPGIWLNHVLAEIPGQDGDGKPILMLQFDVAASAPGAAGVVTPANPGGGSAATAGPAQLILTPRQTAAYLRAVQEFTLQPPGPPPRPLPN
ncbi:MAG: hypothetical protein ACF8XB_09755 [Planctomycetota bacterium JB042]